MLFLTDEEKRSWKDFGDRVLKTHSGPGGDLTFIRPGLVSAFHYYIGTLLLSNGQNEAGEKWTNAGIAGEPGGLFSNAFLSSYLKRNHGALVIPEEIFADPAPYVHFNSTPLLVDSRAKFRTDCARGLPVISQPLKIMDIGCGHGKVLVDLLQELRRKGIIDAIEEIFLVDPSQAMLDLARKNVAASFPEARIRYVQSRFEALSDHIEGHYHIALASLAIHHMPYEKKLDHLGKLRDHIDYFILYELDANNDTPEMQSPEIALSVYQSYGALIDVVFAHDAPIDLALSSIDRFLMSEAIYFFIEPRGRRTDYHMLRSQWHQVFRDGLGMEFSCLCDSTTYGDENIALFTMIYGRER
jgi:SAM-dependent methyltransferase